MSARNRDPRLFQAAVVVAALLGSGIVLMQEFGGDHSIVLASFLGLVVGISSAAAGQHLSTEEMRSWRGLLVLGAWVLPILLFTWTDHNLEVALFAGFGVSNLALALGLAESLDPELGSHQRANENDRPPIH